MNCKFCKRPESGHTPKMGHAYTPLDSKETLQESAKRHVQELADASSSNKVRLTPAGKEESKPVQIRVQQTPFDPALRLALIDAGIITQDQLTAAMEKLSALNNLTRLEEKLSAQGQTGS